MCVGCEAEVDQYAKNKQCRRCYNEYMKACMLALYQERHTRVITELGAKCHRCSTRIGLRVEYRNRALKMTKTSKLYSIGEERFTEELKKCILLCRRCHITWKAQQDASL